MWAALCLILFACPPVQDAYLELDSGALEAYRAGDPASAASLWGQALAQAPEGPERGRLCFNLGNAAYRQGEVVQAVAWYHSALRYLPRDRGVWANLEFARVEADLEPADRGDLADTIHRLLSSLVRAESEWLVAWALALLALTCAGEALRGGAGWRRAVWVNLGLTGLLSGPLLWHVVHDSRSMWMVIAEEGASAQSEPTPDAARVSSFPAGSIMERADELPEWVKLLDDSGRGLWVERSKVFALAR